MSAKSRKAKEEKWGADMQRCSQCVQVLPLAQFLWDGRRGHFKITVCNACAQDNMDRYWRSQMVGKLPEEFEERED